ncbi:MAG: radical SAM family heme chaperone HemW [Lentimicrobiaceae bacterium]|nr:radical SAM family heme chaperone HemW [Lentimicrobiaceae bacterium]
MSGIYVHIPYCRQKCHYCNFFSVASLSSMPVVLNALCTEISLQSSYISGPLNTLYFGGGTPSLLDEIQLTAVMKAIGKNFNFAPDAEITLEANPDDISMEKLKLWKDNGINRLSIGIQSFRDSDLQYLNRIHSADKALKSLNLARQAGFHNLTIDLIFGIPTLNDKAWLENIKIVKDLEIPHISAYALTIEPKTPLDVMIRKGKARPVNEQQTVRQFGLMMQKMEAHGYEHYEISNYCLPGHYARHNTSYWSGIPYLGVGPSAHSYNGNSRQWNVTSISEYIKELQSGKVPAEKEILTVNQHYNEYVMTGLRTARGCDITLIEQRFGLTFVESFKKEAQKWIKQGHLQQNGHIFTLCRSGKLLADGIASDFFIIT